MRALLRELRWFLTKDPWEYADRVERELKRRAHLDVTPLDVEQIFDVEDRRAKRLDKALRRSR